MKTETSVKKYGNSYGILIPKNIINKEDLKTKEQLLGFIAEASGLVLVKASTFLQHNDIKNIKSVDGKIISQSMINKSAIDLKVIVQGTGEVILLSREKLSSLNWMPQQELIITSNNSQIFIEPITGCSTYPEPLIADMNKNDLDVASKISQQRIDKILLLARESGKVSKSELAREMDVFNTINNAWLDNINIEIDKIINP